MRYRIIAVITVLSVLGGTALASLPSLTPDLEWKGRIVVEFAPSLGDLQLDTEAGLVRIGHPALDALARQFEVYRAEKLIPWAEPPQDPQVRDLSRFYILEFPEELNLHAVAAAFAEASGIVSSEPYRVHRSDFTPNDPLFASMWHMNTVHAAQSFDYCQGSPSVIVGIVDSGVDTTHADLRDNLWINPGEDLNQNGIIEPFERNNIDDDGNGLADDFYGWNFWQNNNNVQDMLPVGGHGTSCSGCASAVTHNALGISSLGYKAKILTTKCGDGEFVYNWVSGASYAVTSGAKIINLSFGSSFYSAYEQMVINSLWSMGAAIFGSAGNVPSSAVHYPACYDNVVAVSATNSGDQLASFSAYGTWVDICAPGDMVITAYPGTNYFPMSGTSFSTPISAGLAAQVWAARPAWTNSQVIQHIYNTCTNINAQNPGYIGQLGHGRVDAGAAMMALFPTLSFTQTTFDEVVGNGDPQIDPGETWSLLITVANSSHSVAATGVTVTMTADNPNITFSQGTCNLGNIPVQSSVNNNANPFVFSVAAGAQPFEVIFTLSMTESSLLFPIIWTLPQSVGSPQVLLVDDDGGLNWQVWYEMDLDSLDVLHDTWHVSSQGEIPLAQLQDYSYVIWHTSTQDNPLSAGEQTVISSYLSGGGSLFLTGEDIDEQLAGAPFYANTLRAQSTGLSPNFQANGVPGDTISDGTSLFLVGVGGAGNANSSETIDAVNGGVLIYNYATGPGAGLRWNDAQSHLVYFAFNFEAASGLNNTTPRPVVLANILSFFGYPIAPPPPPPPPVEITLTPVGAPIQIPAGGGSFSYNANLVNASGAAQTFNAWVGQYQPSGAWQGPLLGPLNLTLPNG
ncbi:MAG: hypothetical protein C4524_07120, partial [Candidatus Zixiibacteriota bacterium]